MVSVVLVLLGLYLDNKTKVGKFLGFSSFAHPRKLKKKKKEDKQETRRVYLKTNKNLAFAARKITIIKEIVSESKDQFI